MTEGGTKVLLHVAPGTKESTECCRDFLEDLKRRGLSDPVLVVTDGAPGLIRAVEECFPASLRQRCLAHRMRNLMAKLPDEIQAEFGAAARAAYQAPSLALARAARAEVVARFSKEYPTAVACFEDDFEACIAQLHCPPRHRRVCRTTNFLERLFGEERRRLNAAGTLFGERGPQTDVCRADSGRGTLARHHDDGVRTAAAGAAARAAPGGARQAPCATHQGGPPR